MYGLDDELTNIDCPIESLVARGSAFRDCVSNCEALFQRSITDMSKACVLYRAPVTIWKMA